jgi:hypothetical protein
MNPRFTHRKPSANNKSTGLRALYGLKLLLCSGALLGMAAAQASPFYVGASGGYSAVSGTHDEPGSIAGRLVLGMNAYETEPVIWGLELGVQSGSDVGLEASNEVLGSYYDGPIHANLKPLADILLTGKTESSVEEPWSAFAKVGAALRQLNLTDRSSSQDNITRFAPEVQLGVGYQVSKKATLVLYYQGIYAQSDAGASLDDEGNTRIDHIPMQNGGFLGVEYKL